MALGQARQRKQKISQRISSTLLPSWTFCALTCAGGHLCSPAASVRVRARERTLISPSVSAPASIFTRPLQNYHAKCKCRRVAPRLNRMVRFARDQRFFAEKLHGCVLQLVRKKNCFVDFSDKVFRGQSQCGIGVAQSARDAVQKAEREAVGERRQYRDRVEKKFYLKGKSAEFKVDNFPTSVANTNDTHNIHFSIATACR